MCWAGKISISSRIPAARFSLRASRVIRRFVPASEFFNDVWRSGNGRDWACLTTNAAWHGRAGLSSVVLNDEIYVLGGSFNDDSSIVGGPPARVYFNDVWKSRDGANWVSVTTNAPWAPRAGAAVVAKGGYIYLLGGEDGFLCDTNRPDRCPPYFNDVWRSRDGANWELVTAAAAWPSRPGHQAVVLANNIYPVRRIRLELGPSGSVQTRESDGPVGQSQRRRLAADQQLALECNDAGRNQIRLQGPAR